ncbi:MAG: IS4/Tn5 family transposase DNA-binding protein, partial [Candidatus Dormibacteraceae bacterium]
MEDKTLTDPLAWAQETFGDAELGDPRRTRRLVRVAAQVAADPQGSLPREMGGDWGALKAAYRLVRADGVSHEAISRPVWQQTRKLVASEPGVVLLVHDDTEVDFGYRPAIRDLGPIGNGSHRGFFVHTVLALVPRGERERVLGVLQQEAWVRQPTPPPADGRTESRRQRAERPRESEVWTRAVEQVGSPPQGQVWLHVADRYADMFAFLQGCRQLGTFFLVRAAQNRRVQAVDNEAEPELDHLLDRARNWPTQAHGRIEVPSEHERRARTAQVQLSWGGLQLLPPEHGPSAGAAPLPLWVVRVWEPQPPRKADAQREFVPSQKHGPNRHREPPREEVEALE